MSEFFEPVPIEEIFPEEENQIHNKLGNLIIAYKETGDFPDYSQADIAIIGVKEDRNAVNNAGCAEGPDVIRKYLYRLAPGPFKPRIIDLGNIKTGYTPSDTYFALSSIVSELLAANILPIILGEART